MLRKFINIGYHFAKIDKPQILVSAFSTYSKLANNKYYCLLANRKRINFFKQYCCERQNISENIKHNNCSIKNNVRYNIAIFFAFVIGTLGLINKNKARADEDDENTINDNSLQSQEKFDELSKRLTGDLPSPITNYVDLQGKKELLNQKLNEKEVVLICGAGGMGKSTLVAQYANECKQKGDTQVIWIRGPQIEEEFFRLAETLGIETNNLNCEIIKNLVYRNLQILFDKKRLILIFDNVEEKEKLKQYLISLPNIAKVIITTRNVDLLEGRIKPFKIQGFNEEEADVYLREALKISKEEAEKIIDVVSESPFRLSKVVAYLKKHTLTLEEFIEIYLRIRRGENQNKEIYPEIEMLFGDLKTVSPKAWDLLKYLAYLNIEGVSIEFITDIIEESRHQLEEYVNELDKSSLTQIIIRDNEITLKIHKIVQIETRKALIEENKTQVYKILEKLVNKLNKMLSKDNENSKNLQQIAVLVNHGQTLIEGINEANLTVVGQESLLNMIGDYHFNIVFNYPKAIYYWEKELELEKSVRNSNVTLINTLHNLASAHKELGGSGSLTRGLEYSQEALSIANANAIFIEDNENVARILNCMSLIYLKIGGENALKEALKYGEKSLGMRQSLFSENHPDTAISFNNMGTTYCAFGGKENVQKGLDYQKKALKIYTANFTGDNSIIATILDTIGSSHELLGGEKNIQKALKYKKEALRMSRALFNENHPQIAISLHNVGFTYEKLGGKNNLQIAIKYRTEALRILQVIFPYSHPDVATALYSLGQSYNKIKGFENIKKGIEYETEALKMRQALFPGNHADKALSLSSLGLSYARLGEQNNLNEGLCYLKQALEIWEALFGTDHREIAIALDNIGWIYTKLGGEENLYEGLKYYERSLNIRQTLFPKTHPDIATSLSHLASVFIKLGRKEDLEEALKYYKKVLKINEFLFLNNHQNIATSLFNVGWVYIELGGESNIHVGLKYHEKSLKMRQILFSNHIDIARSLQEIGYIFEILGDKSKNLEYMKQAYSIFQSVYEEDIKAIKKLKKRIEVLQPNFFKDGQEIQKQKESICLHGNKVGDECRWIIISRGNIEDDLIIIKQRLQKVVLNNLVKAVEEKGWSSMNWRWSDEGIKVYLDNRYLSKKLETKDNQEIEIAQMLCFESMNLGIMKSEKKPYFVVQEFTRENPELVKKIAKEHPEFFVDGSIVEASIEAMPDDAGFKEHILKHVKYMGMETRKERGF